MTSVKRLAFASTAATFLLVAIGGLVRATKSGLGCGTDWPDCAGDVIPIFGSRAVVIEFSHRLMATVVVILLGTLAVTAWKSRAESPTIFRTSLAAFGLVLFQAGLGAVVVFFELRADTVVIHLAAAMSLVALLIYLCAKAAVEDGAFMPATDESIARRAKLAALGVLILLLVGSYLTGRNAGYVFTDWPLMDGRLIPDLSYEPAAIHFLHRALAALTGIVVFAVGIAVVRRKERFPLQARFAHAAMGLFGLQVLIGAGNVWNPPPSITNELLVTAHLLTAALIWGCLVALTVISNPSLIGDRSQDTVRATPVYEGRA